MRRATAQLFSCEGQPNAATVTSEASHTQQQQSRGNLRRDLRHGNNESGAKVPRKSRDGANQDRRAGQRLVLGSTQCDQQREIHELDGYERTD